MRTLLTILALLLAAPVAAQPRTTGSLTSATCPGTGCLALSVTGQGAVAIQITGTWMGTVTFEGSVDGLTFQALTVFPTNSTTGATTTTGNGVWSAAVAGLTIVRARMSSYTSGTATVSMGLASASARAAGGGGGGGGGGGAPTDATYLVQTANGDLPNAQDLGSLSSGIMRVATTTGVVTSLTDSDGVRANVSDATGTGSLVFADSPTISGWAWNATTGGMTATSSAGTGSSTLSFTPGVSSTTLYLRRTDADPAFRIGDLSDNRFLQLRYGVTSSPVFGTYSFVDDVAGHAPMLAFRAAADNTIDQVSLLAHDGTYRGLNMKRTGAMTFDGPSWAFGTATVTLNGVNAASVAQVKQKLTFVIDGGGSTITTGFKGCTTVPVAGTITGWSILSDDASITSGSIVIDLWEDTQDNYAPTDADSITASAPPTVSGTTNAFSTTLTGWSTSLVSGGSAATTSVVCANVDSVTDLTRVHLDVYYQP